MYTYKKINFVILNEKHKFRKFKVCALENEMDRNKIKGKKKQFFFTFLLLNLNYVKNDYFHTLFNNIIIMLHLIT